MCVCVWGWGWVGVGVGVGVSKGVLHLWCMYAEIFAEKIFGGKS